MRSIDSDEKNANSSQENFDNFHVLKISDSSEFQLANGAPSNFDSVCVSIIEDELEANAYDIFLHINSWVFNRKCIHVQKALNICYNYERIRIIIFFLESRAGNYNLVNEFLEKAVEERKIAMFESIVRQYNHPVNLRLFEKLLMLDDDSNVIPKILKKLYEKFEQMKTSQKHCYLILGKLCFREFFENFLMSVKHYNPSTGKEVLVNWLIDGSEEYFASDQKDEFEMIKKMIFNNERASLDWIKDTLCSWKGWVCYSHYFRELFCLCVSNVDIFWIQSLFLELLSLRNSENICQFIFEKSCEFQNTPLFELLISEEYCKKPLVSVSCFESSFRHRNKLLVEKLLDYYMYLESFIPEDKQFLDAHWVHLKNLAKEKNCSFFMNLVQERALFAYFE